MAEGWFDRILSVEVAAGADIEEVNVEGTNVVAVGEVLRLNAEDEHAAVEVQP